MLEQAGDGPGVFHVAGQREAEQGKPHRLFVVGEQQLAEHDVGPLPLHVGHERVKVARFEDRPDAVNK